MLVRKADVTAARMHVLEAVWAPPAEDDEPRKGAKEKVAQGPPVEVATAPTPQRVTPPATDAQEAERAAQRRAANQAMEQYAAGASDAFRELYRCTSERLLHYLLRRVGDPVRAEDLLQQTFLHMHQARGRFRSGAEVFPWMYAIAHRLVIDYVRRGGREVPLDPGGEGGAGNEPVCPRGAADELLIAEQLNQRINRAKVALPENQRAVWELIRVEELSYREAAEALGLTVSAVTSLLHRANETLNRVRERLED